MMERALPPQGETVLTPEPPGMQVATALCVPKLLSILKFPNELSSMFQEAQLISAYSK